MVSHFVFCRICGETSMDIFPEEVFTYKKPYKVHLQLNLSSTLPAHCAKYTFQTKLELIDHMNIGPFTI